MHNKLNLSSNGGVFHFDICSQKNILREFLTLKRLSNKSSKRFSYVPNSISYNNNISVKEYVFKDCTDDFSRFDIVEALKLKKADHLSELLYNRDDLDSCVFELNQSTAKYYEIISALLRPNDTMLLIDLSSTAFTQLQNERLARVLKRESLFKNRIILIHGQLPTSWSELLDAKIVPCSKKVFAVRQVLKQDNDNQSQKPREMVKFSA